jgi:hypothetical protein
MTIQVALRVTDGSLVSFSYEGEDYRVSDVLECWLVGDEVAFRVVADGQTFDLRGARRRSPGRWTRCQTASRHQARNRYVKVATACMGGSRFGQPRGARSK